MLQAIINHGTDSMQLDSCVSKKKICLFVNQKVQWGGNVRKVLHKEQGRIRMQFLTSVLTLL